MWLHSLSVFSFFSHGKATLLEVSLHFVFRKKTRLKVSDDNDAFVFIFSASALFRTTHPSSVVWWCPQDRHNYAIIGTKLGWIVLVDLIEGKEVGFSHFTNFPIIQVELLFENVLFNYVTPESTKGKRSFLKKKKLKEVTHT